MFIVNSRPLEHKNAQHEMPEKYIHCENAKIVKKNYPKLDIFKKIVEKNCIFLINVGKTVLNSKKKRAETGKDRDKGQRKHRERWKWSENEEKKTSTQNPRRMMKRSNENDDNHEKITKDRSHTVD